MSHHLDLESEVAKIKWFHQIDLGKGLVTPGFASAQRIPDMHLPTDMTGLSVLDIGAWDGFFSFECERRGADVLATDYFCWGESAHTKAGFDLAKRILGSRVREQKISVEDISPTTVGTFDIVLFLGVLYHATDPIGYLQRVRSVAKQYAIIETHVDLLDVPRPALAYYHLACPLNGDPTNFFGPNELAVKAMCATAGFARCDQISSVPGLSRMTFKAYV